MGGRDPPAILFRLQKNKSDYYRRIILQLRRMIPGFRDFALEPENSHILLRWRGGDPEYIFGPHQLSDGSLRLMALTTLFLQPPEDLPDMIIVDEPELGLHPEAEALIAGLIRSAALQCQWNLSPLRENRKPKDGCDVVPSVVVWAPMARGETSLALIEAETAGVVVESGAEARERKSRLLVQA